ncbi:unnamed protein product [Adineta steineri]|uniref:G-protein coupled receptors family 1 profile domain-containing protein n=2 Tax=Adineta steineri TaxID=433720 RepID=A0A815SWX6_9BILA|nr:unnamed protein product [Adineta steineri]
MTDSYITTLGQVISKITLYVPYFTITLGTVGALCNILTFSAKKLRQNSCAFYFLCSSVFDILTLLICGTLRLMVDHYQYALNQTAIFCKIRVYLTGVFPGISTACLVLATIDRCWLTSSLARWRRWSKITIAYRLVIVAIIVWLISPAHMLVFYDFYTINGVPNICSSQPGVYSTFISAFLVIWLTIIPYICMFIASIMTFSHIRASRERVMAFQQQQQQQQQREAHRRVDRHLILIMFIQVILSVILLSLRTVVIAYTYLTRDVVKDSRSRAIESFFSQFGTVVYYINYAKSFYLCTLASPLFRQVFWNQLNQFKNYITHSTRENAVVPISITAATKKRSNQDVLND